MLNYSVALILKFIIILFYFYLIKVNNKDKTKKNNKLKFLFEEFKIESFF